MVQEIENRDKSRNVYDSLFSELVSHDYFRMGRYLSLLVFGWVDNMNLPDDLNKFLTLLRKKVVCLLGDKIVGIYIYGSISYGDFEESRSDVDVMVFLKSKLSGVDIKALKKTYASPKIKNSKWIEKLEMDYVFVGDMDPMRNTVNTVVFRGCKLIKSSIEGLSMDLKNILECGIILYGPKPSVFIPEIREELLNGALLDKFIHLKENAPKWSGLDFWNQMYIMIQLCRIIYSIKNGDNIISKKKATEWCRENVPMKYRSIVETSLGGIDNWERPIDREIGEKLFEFMSYVEELLNERTHIN